MTRHIAQKIATAFVTIYVIITISFFLVHIMPGDPVIHLVGQEEYYYLLDNDPETLNKLIARYGRRISGGSVFQRKSLTTLPLSRGSFPTTLPDWPFIV